MSIVNLYVSHYFSSFIMSCTHLFTSYKTLQPDKFLSTRYISTRYIHFAFHAKFFTMHEVRTDCNVHLMIQAFMKLGIAELKQVGIPFWGIGPLEVHVL